MWRHSAHDWGPDRLRTALDSNQKEDQSDKGGRQWWPERKTRGPVPGGPTVIVAETSGGRTFTGASRSLRLLKKSSHSSAGEHSAESSFAEARWIVAHHTGAIWTDLSRHCSESSSG